MTHAHEARAPARVACAVLTVSDTRGPKDDAGGDAVAAALAEAGHDVAAREWVRDDREAIAAAARRLLADARVDALLSTGGTGVAPRDVTPEALRPLLDKELPGFGEAFRRAGEADVGAVAWLSRAGAGVAGGKVVAWLPGSPAGAALGARLLAGELRHLLGLVRRP